MHCPYCKNEISENANFCQQCGNEIPRCPSCGHVILKKEDFCPIDGTPLTADMFADWSLDESFCSTGVFEAEPIESEITDDFDEEYDDDDFDEEEYEEKSNWKPVFIAAAIIGILCIFISYIAVVTGPGTLKKDATLQMETPAKHPASQETDGAENFRESDMTFFIL